MRTQALLNFCSWIEQTSFSLTIQSTPWIVPSVQTVHILAIAAVLSSALMLNLRLLGVVAREQSLARVSDRFRPVIWSSLPILLVSGMVMIAGEPARSLANAVFQLKMLLLLAAIALTLVFKVRADEADSVSVARKVTAVLSLMLWTAIVFSGRWIAYT